VAAKTKTPTNSGIERTIAIMTAEAWRPTPGEFRTFKLIMVRRGRDAGYGAYPVLICENDENGVFALHAFHTLDKETLSEIRPAKGATLTYFYGGLRETNASRKDFDSGKIEEKDRKYYHHSLLIAGDGTDVDFEADTEEYDYDA
jgi:hypothetical protein